MTRAVLAMMAGLLCAFAGMKYASALKADASRLNRWVQLLRHLALLVREGTMALPEILWTVADESGQPDMLLREMARHMQTSPLLTMAEAYLHCSAPTLEKDVLSRMFARLGRGTKESRSLAVEQSAEEMVLLAEKSSARAEKDAKLWQTLGFTGGICLTILLL